LIPLDAWSLIFIPRGFFYTRSKAGGVLLLFGYFCSARPLQGIINTLRQTAAFQHQQPHVITMKK